MGTDNLPQFATATAEKQRQAQHCQRRIKGTPFYVPFEVMGIRQIAARTLFDKITQRGFLGNIDVWQSRGFEFADYILGVDRTAGFINALPLRQTISA